MLVQSLPYPPIITGPAPSFGGSGLLASNQANAFLAIPYPTSPVVGDIFFINGTIYDILGAGARVTSIPGFTQIFQTHLGTNQFFSDLWWRRADGTETGSVMATFSEAPDGPGGIAIFKMSKWSGCKAVGDPFESATSNSQSATTAHVGSAINTLGHNRKVVTFCSGCNPSSVGSPTNGWTEELEETSSIGNNGFININTLQVSNPGAVAAMTRTMSPSVVNMSFTLALIPA